MTTSAETVIHVVRHGEVFNPERVLYGRLPGFHLSELGREMAELTADYLADRDVTEVISSPLERAQETATPIAQRHGLPLRIDRRIIESENQFEGVRVGGLDGAIRSPKNWHLLINPFRPSWGEPYPQIATRMMAALDSARLLAAGHEAVMVSHQLPVWTLRRHLEGKRLWHDPRQRECTLASVTSVRYRGEEIVDLTYAEPAGALLPMAQPGAGA
ncbi:histidine phosphatase family protein [Ornithinimicrobium sp. Arc0846-15]|nr:histidine phosphatase family protein [Ornithinimicrobium laminariae]